MIEHVKQYGWNFNRAGPLAWDTVGIDSTEYVILGPREVEVSEGSMAGEPSKVELILIVSKKMVWSSQNYHCRINEGTISQGLRINVCRASMNSAGISWD
jgi:hypothetical protein